MSTETNETVMLVDGRRARLALPLCHMFASMLDDVGERAFPADALDHRVLFETLLSLQQRAAVAVDPEAGLAVCPWCRKADMLRADWKVTRGDSGNLAKDDPLTWWAVDCLRCGAHGPTARPGESAALEAWNKRVSPVPAPQWVKVEDGQRAVYEVCVVEPTAPYICGIYGPATIEEITHLNGGLISDVEGWMIPEGAEVAKCRVVTQKGETQYGKGYGDVNRIPDAHWLEPFEWEFAAPPVPAGGNDASKSV